LNVFIKLLVQPPIINQISTGSHENGWFFLAMPFALALFPLHILTFWHSGLTQRRILDFDFLGILDFFLILGAFFNMRNPDTAFCWAPSMLEDSTTYWSGLS
jgi:hypothetical protein